MGVFARFRRRKESAEASSQETAAVTSAVEPADTAEETAEASGTAEAGRPGEAAAAEGVEIPKQQSAEEAADNEAGEGARK